MPEFRHRCLTASASEAGASAASGGFFSFRHKINCHDARWFGIKVRGTQAADVAVLGERRVGVRVSGKENER